MRCGLGLALVVGLLSAGCGALVGSSPADFIKELATDPASNCITVVSPYGSVSTARGTPGMRVVMQAAACTIESTAPASSPAK